MTIPLSRAALSRLPATIAVPVYGLAAVTPGIVHLGLGGFHRAHMARYTHDLMNLQPEARAWGIAGAGLMPADRRMRDVLTAQDNLYTLVEQDGATEQATVIGALTDVIFAGDDTRALLDAIDAPGIRIVSATVTENGYCLSRATKRLDLEHPLIAADRATPRAPKSLVGIVTEAYRRRRDAGRKAFTALSCDNIQHNGNVLRQAVADFANAIDPELAQWIAEHARFPNTMVDRITPVTSDAAIADLAARHGIADGWPVFCETFRQWVIEDDFADGRPEWEAVGAQFTTDVTPYEKMKLRLLNASHLAIAAPGRLMGYTFIHETMQDARLRRYMAALMDRETGPTLSPVPGVDLADYKATLTARFANPAIRDTVERVNTDAPLNYLLDPIRDRLAEGAPVPLLAFAVAAWMRRVRGVDENGAAIDVRHPLAAELRARAEQGGGDPRPLLGLVSLFGDVGRDVGMIDATGKWLGTIYAHGTARALDRLREEEGI
ncbi:MAG TPA: mannitol dehydrogenase family protein [Rhizomicrobium sp.]|jgi:mannitol-1-phosphate/altronate dehydrogenase|nr:mannitol dehydrogenase family protein [Rhizomicrobium sp.]